MAGSHIPVPTQWPADGACTSDGQWRRAEVVTRWQQYQLRPGLNYHARPNVLVTLGYAFTRTYPYGEIPVARAFPEHRIYQQALVTQRRTNVTFQHRLRMEQRFIQYPNTHTSWTYQNPFRYLAKVEVPLAIRTDGSTSWYLPALDEILIGIPPNFGARPFDQNRLFAGVGYALGRTKFEAGYLNQFLGQRNGRVFEMNNTLFVTVTSTLSFSDIFSD
jgi:hypothetical protein